MSSAAFQDYGLVSIVMPAYNAERFIAESVESVLAQTYQNWELLVVDDCSTDSTAEIVRGFKDARIRYFCNPTNQGAAMSRNRALREAQGRWMAFLDCDDLWLPDKLDKQLRFMSNERCSFSYTKYETLSETGEHSGTVISGPKVVSPAKMRVFCWPGCLTVMYDRDSVGLVQIENLPKHNDYAMWLKVSKGRDCLLIPEVLAYYRVRSSSVSHGMSLSSQLRDLYRLWRIGENKTPISASLRTLANCAGAVYKKLVFQKS